MDLKDLGWSDFWESNFEKENNHSVARVISEEKESYFVQTEKSKYFAQITGNLRFTANDRLDFPIVGDWVLITELDETQAIIHKILPRKSILKRKSVSSKSEVQPLASNVDFALIMQSLDQNYNLNRIERYLSITNVDNIKSILIFTKLDLLSEDEIEKYKKEISERVKNVPFVFISNITKEGLGIIKEYLKPGNTFCVLGSSGVGKSSFINSIVENNLLKIGEVSYSNTKGKHTTTHRELIITETFGILIDTPGMREIGLTSEEEGLIDTFEDIYNLENECRYNNCTHISEEGCAVLGAIESGELSLKSFENFQKMKREQEHFSMNNYERRSKDKKFGKMVKKVMSEKKKGRGG
ncbi:MAG: ribosome small subunit-dependent GTPase A [Leptospiraceae bacterium]|nr:ribosome small subunit-dependent GTPase A [Leptospiraceae bacterium]